MNEKKLWAGLKGKFWNIFKNNSKRFKVLLGYPKFSWNILLIRVFLAS